MVTKKEKKHTRQMKYLRLFSMLAHCFLLTCYLFFFQVLFVSKPVVKGIVMY